MRTERYIEPRDVPLDQFPASRVGAARMQDLASARSASHPRVHLGVEYARVAGSPLHLQVIVPPGDGEDDRLPLVLYVPGSGWGPQDLGQHLAALIAFARRGFVVAIVEYRPSDLAPFPAQVQDAVRALAFMRANAGRFRVDPDRVVAWGDSSGAHTSLLLAYGLEDPYFSGRDCGSSSVRCVVDYFGPTDLATMNDEPSICDHLGAESPEGVLMGGVDVLSAGERLERSRVLGQRARSRARPRVLILHGDRDRLVGFGQSATFADAVAEDGDEVELYRVIGADHGGSVFWADGTLDLVESFVRAALD